MNAIVGKTLHLAIGVHVRCDDGEAETHEFVVDVPDGLRWFQGHFQGNPVLPAVVQTLEVLRLVTATWPDLVGLRRIVRAKFQKPIRPGDSLSLRLTRARGSNKAAFEYRRDQETCSSGTMEFDDAPGVR